MTKEEMKDKYRAFIEEISEILGLEKPIDILKLCATTDSFFRPLEKRITELEALTKKVKRCFNCKYQNKFVESKCGECEDYSKWEIKENDKRRA